VNQQASPSNLYIDSVKMIDYKKNKALLISGNMANGCTYLREASHTVEGDSLKLSMTTWQPADKMCSQALVPFSFIYDDFPQEKLNGKKTMSLNKKSFKIKR